MDNSTDPNTQNNPTAGQPPIDPLVAQTVKNFNEHSLPLEVPSDSGVVLGGTAGSNDSYSNSGLLTDSFMPPDQNDGPARHHNPL